MPEGRSTFSKRRAAVETDRSSCSRRRIRSTERSGRWMAPQLAPCAMSVMPCVNRSRSISILRTVAPRALPISTFTITLAFTACLRWCSACLVSRDLGSLAMKTKGGWRTSSIPRCRAKPSQFMAMDTRYEMCWRCRICFALLRLLMKTAPARLDRCTTLEEVRTTRPLCWNCSVASSGRCTFE